MDEATVLDMLDRTVSVVDDETLKKMVDFLNTTFTKRYDAKVKMVIKKLSDAIEFANDMGFTFRCYATPELCCDETVVEITPDNIHSDSGSFEIYAC